MADRRTRNLDKKTGALQAPVLNFQVVDRVIRDP